MPNSPSMMAVQGNTLLIATIFSEKQNSIAYYDGDEWNKVLHEERPAKKSGEKSILELMLEREKENQELI